MLPVRHEPTSMRLELIKATFRRYVPAAIAESVVKRAVVMNHVDVQNVSLEQLEAVVAASIAGLQRIVDSKVMSTLVIDLSEILADANDEFEAYPTSTRGHSSLMRFRKPGP